VIAEKTSVKDIPIDLIDPLEEFSQRFDLEVCDLKESIKAQGQLEPGHVIRLDGGRFGLYRGYRRLEAIRQLRRETSLPRFSTYRAFIDEGLSRERMWEAALDEDRTGVHQEKSTLELVDTMRRAVVSPSYPHYSKYREISRLLTTDEIKKLYAMEKASGFRFSYEHIRELTTKTVGRESMLLTATLVADVKASPSQVEQVSSLQAGAKAVRWAPDVIPEYVPKAAAPPIDAERVLRSLTDSMSQTAPETDAPSHPEQKLRHESKVDFVSDAILVNCTSCHKEIGFTATFEARVEMLALAPGQRKVPIAPVLPPVSFGCECPACGAKASFRVKHLGGPEYEVNGVVVKACPLQWNHSSGKWERLA
jgi:hypothetical protein